MNVKSEFLHTLKQRGYIHQCTDIEALDQLLTEQIVTGYIGFDCTGRSLHVGSLVQIMMLRKMQQCGHRPLVLMGGGTSKIGDPSGKDEARQLLSQQDIETNKQSIAEIFSQFLKFGEGSTDAKMLDNSEWLDSLGYINFLRNYGRHFSVNRMLTMDSVRLRLERQDNLSFLEFNYMLLQAFDFVELNRLHGCRVQFGGSDQWGNLVSGADLGRRLQCPELYGLTSPLITTSSGAKMGKTASGAIWLRADMLSPYDYWQFWRNTEDTDVPRFLKLFTELPMAEIKKLAALRDHEINEAKKILAHHATTLCHGEQAALEAMDTAKNTFEEGGLGKALPTYQLSRAEAEGMAVFKLFTICGLCASGGEARRLIQGGGAKLNNKPLQDEMAFITLEDFPNGEAKLSAGKKQHIIVKLG